MRIRVWPLLALLFCVPVQAQILPRENPVPGGIVVVPVAAETEPAPEVYYDNQRVLVMSVPSLSSVTGQPDS